MTDNEKSYTLVRSSPEEMNLNIAMLGVLLGVYVALPGMVVWFSQHWAVKALFFVWIISLCCASIAVCSPSYSQVVQASLKVGRYLPAYRFFMRSYLLQARKLLGLRRSVIEDQPPIDTIREVSRYNVLDRAMFFATVYPIFSIILHWAWTGQEGKLGRAVILNSGQDELLRNIILGTVFALPVVWQIQRIYVLKDQELAQKMGSWMVFAFLGITIGTIILIGSPFLVFIAFLVLFMSYGFGVASSSNELSPGAASLFFAAILPTGFLVYFGFFSETYLAIQLLLFFIMIITFGTAYSLHEKLLNSGKRIYASVYIILLPFCFVCLIGFLFPWSITDSQTKSIFLFVCVLPFINGAWDAFSYSVTLTFAQLGLRKNALFWGSLDAVLAMATFLFLGFSLVAMIAFLNYVSGVEFVLFYDVFSNILDWETYGWLYIMLFSTAVPTMLHIGVACFSVQALIAPPKLRSWIGQQTELAKSGDPGHVFAASFSLGTMWLVSFLAGLVVFAMVAWLCSELFLLDLLDRYRAELISYAIDLGAI